MCEFSKRAGRARTRELDDPGAEQCLSADASECGRRGVARNETRLFDRDGREGGVKRGERRDGELARGGGGFGFGEGRFGDALSAGAGAFFAAGAGAAVSG